MAGIMFYHNALQIRENSEGEENAFMGDSDFRPLGGRFFGDEGEETKLDGGPRVRKGSGKEDEAIYHITYNNN